MKVPNGAIFRRGEQWHAYVLNNNRAELRPVRIGRASNTETEILEGLKEGELLITGLRQKEPEMPKVTL